MRHGILIFHCFTEALLTFSAIYTFSVNVYSEACQLLLRRCRVLHMAWLHAKDKNGPVLRNFCCFTSKGSPTSCLHCGDSCVYLFWPCVWYLVCQVQSQVLAIIFQERNSQTKISSQYPKEILKHKYVGLTSSDGEHAFIIDEASEVSMETNDCQPCFL